MTSNHSSASESARKYGIDAHFKEKMQSKVKQRFDEFASDIETEKNYLKLQFSIMYQTQKWLNLMHVLLVRVQSVKY